MAVTVYTVYTEYFKVHALYSTIPSLWFAIISPKAIHVVI